MLKVHLIILSILSLTFALQKQTSTVPEQQDCIPFSVETSQPHQLFNPFELSEIAIEWSVYPVDLYSHSVWSNLFPQTQDLCLGTGERFIFSTKNMGSQKGIKKPHSTSSSKIQIKPFYICLSFTLTILR